VLILRKGETHRYTATTGFNHAGADPNPDTNWNSDTLTKTIAKIAAGAFLQRRTFVISVRVNTRLYKPEIFSGKSVDHVKSSIAMTQRSNVSQLKNV
jgi:hypothetical protein